MTHQEIKDLAGHRAVSPWIMKLVNDAVMKEREACALICEKTKADVITGNAVEAFNYATKYIAKLIRARGQA